MKPFEIREHGNKFATIEAANATSALRKAAQEYPRRACDYNMADGDEPVMIEWCAFDIENPASRAFAKVVVPGVGLEGCEF